MNSSITRARRYVGAAVCVGAMLMPLTASADKSAEPAESGVVVRFETAGGHFVVQEDADVGGATLDVLAVFGFASIADICANQPAPNGVEQVVPTPSGNVNVIVHNSDVPVLLFDVTEIATEGEFFARCAEGGVPPFAEGTAKQRPIIHVSETSFSITVKSRGEVVDTTGQTWTLQSFLRLQETPETPPTRQQWLKLTAD